MLNHKLMLTLPTGQAAPRFFCSNQSIYLSLKKPSSNAVYDHKSMGALALMLCANGSTNDTTTTLCCCLTNAYI